VANISSLAPSSAGDFIFFLLSSTSPAAAVFVFETFPTGLLHQEARSLYERWAQGCGEENSPSNG
jgi:hypothetical protein